MSKENENNILIIVAARLARRECLTKLHDLCDLEQRVVSKRGVRDAVEHAEEAIARECSKIVRGHNMLAKKLLDAESEVSALQEQARALASENAVLKNANSIANNILNDEETMVTSLWASSVQKVEVSTPATDAALREIRCQVVDAAIDAMVRSGAQSFGDCVAAVNSIRAGDQP